MIGSAVQNRLSSFALSALARLMPSDDLSAEAQYLRASQADDTITSGDLDRYLANPAPSDEPLLRLAQALGLTPGAQSRMRGARPTDFAAALTYGDGEEEPEAAPVEDDEE